MGPWRRTAHGRQREHYGTEEAAAEQMHSPRRTRIWLNTQPLLLFAALYVWLWLRVDTSLMFHDVVTAYFPVFSWRIDFLHEFLLRPGGPIECLTYLILQAYYYPWAGALVLTAVAAALSWSTDSVLRALAGGPVRIVRHLPACVVVVLASQYRYDLGSLMALVMAMLIVSLYLRALRCGTSVRLSIFVVLGALLYYGAGGAVLLYAVLGAMVEFRVTRERRLGLFYLLAALAIPYALGILAFGMAPDAAFTTMLPLEPEGGPGAQAAPSSEVNTLLAGLYLFLLLGGVLAALYGHLAERRRGGGTEVTDTPARRGRLRRILGGPAFEFAFIFLAAVAIIHLCSDGSTRSLLRVNRAAVQKRWPELLMEVRRAPEVGRGVVVGHLVTRALYEVGELPDRQFSFPMSPATYMLSWGQWSVVAGQRIRSVAPLDIETPLSAQQIAPREKEAHSAYYPERDDLALQLGLVNRAEQEARDALAAIGPRPEILRRLSLINVVKERPEAAEVFLHAMSATMHHGRWAGEALRRLKADPLWSSDPEIERIRAAMPIEDVISLIRPSNPNDYPPSVQDELDELLRRNPHNRMAYEYKMALHLLTWRIDEVVRELDRLDEFDYPEAPRHYQEAAAIYEAIHREDPDLAESRASPEVREAFSDFRQRLARYFEDTSRSEVMAELASDYGNSYFHYYFFGISGVGEQ